MLNERLFLVGVITQKEDKQEKIDLLNELVDLGKTSGGEVVEKIIQHREKIDPRYFIGKGKAEELAKIAEELNINIFIFDTELSGIQKRNLEEMTGRKVLDRTELILDIFSKHASSMGAKIEVEITQLKYSRSRLTGKGIEMSRLGGGIGTMGPGEKKLETDRRKIKDRLHTLNKKLEMIEKSRIVQSNQRRSLRRVALVGYTNAGKSTIMNKLTRSDLLVENKLFSTLDSTTRTLMGPNLEKVLVTDTVGFLRKLPHELINSFKSTLQEAIEADLRLHVVDISHPSCEEHLAAGNALLEELGVIKRPMIYVFNKIDKDAFLVDTFRNKYPDALFISAHQDIQPVKDAIFSFFSLI
ncbi:MAG: GTPase HflX [bacterium]|nr:GTPase HflX [bacterium]